MTAVAAGLEQPRSPDVAAPSASAWTERSTPEGRKFYFNKQTKERTWKRPEKLVQQKPPTKVSGSKKPPTPTAPAAPSPPTTGPPGSSDSSTFQRKSQFSTIRAPRASKLALYAYYSTDEAPKRPTLSDGDSGRPPSDGGDTGTSGGRNGWYQDDEGFWVRMHSPRRPPPFLSSPPALLPRTHAPTARPRSHFTPRARAPCGRHALMISRPSTPPTLSLPASQLTWPLCLTSTSSPFAPSVRVPRPPRPTRSSCDRRLPRSSCRRSRCPHRAAAAPPPRQVQRQLKRQPPPHRRAKLPPTPRHRQ